MNGAFTLDPRLAEDTHRIGALRLSELLLMDDARFPWLILVPRIAGARELIDLDATDRSSLLDEITTVGRALETSLRPDKLNIAALGNVVAQLHVHVIARFHGDAAWPAPVWGQGEHSRYSETARAERLASLRAAMSAALA